MKALSTPAKVARLRALLARGATVRKASKRLGVPRTTIHNWIQKYDLPHREAKDRGLDPDTRAILRRLVNRGLTLTQLCQQAAVSRRTAWLYRQLAAFRGLVKRANTPLPCEAWRCPAGGELLKLTICIEHGVHRPPRACRRDQK